MRGLFPTLLLLAGALAWAEPGPAGAQERTGTWRLVEVRNLGPIADGPALGGMFLHVEGETRDGEMTARFIVNPDDIPDVGPRRVVSAAARWNPLPETVRTGTPFRFGASTVGDEAETILLVMFQFLPEPGADWARGRTPGEIDLIQRDEGSWPATPDPDQFAFLEVQVDATSEFTVQLPAPVGVRVTTLNGRVWDQVSYTYQWEEGAASGADTEGAGPPTDEVGPEEGTEPVDGSRTPWKDVTGTGAAGAAAVGAAAAALAAASRRRRRKSAKENGKEKGADRGQDDAEENAEEGAEEKPVGYVLQLSTRQLTLKPGEVARLTATVWEVNSKGQPSRAAGAAISLSLPGAKGISLTPEAGQGQVVATITAAPDAPSFTGTLGVRASAGGVGHSGSVSVTVEAMDLEVVTDPGGKDTLRADGRDGVWIMARAGGEGEKASKDTEAISFTGEGSGGEWLDFSEPQLSDGWKMVYVQASDPGGGARGTTQAPASLCVLVATVGDGPPLSRRVTFQVPTEPELDAAPDLVEMAAGSRAREAVRVWVDPAEGLEWAFGAEFQGGSKPVAELEVDRLSANSATLFLTECCEKPSAAGGFETSVIRIVAEAKDRDPLERLVKVVVGRQGLVIDKIGSGEDDRYAVAADGSRKVTEVDFRVFMYSEAEEKVVSDTALVKTLAFDRLDPPGTPPTNAMDFGRFDLRFLRIRAGNMPSGTYRIAMEKAIPSDGSTLPASFRVSVPGQEGEEFTAVLKLGLRTSGLGVGGRDWKIELEKCQKIVSDYVPTAQWPKMQALLDRRSRVLGPEGLFALRKQIWKITEQLILAEGERAYEDEARWADRVVQLCEWTEWGSDLAFDAIATSTFGVVGGAGATLVKESMKSALVALVHGKGAEEWLDEQLMAFLGAGELVGFDAMAKYFKDNPAKCYAIFVSYAFLRNLIVKGDTLWDAAKGASLEAGTKLLWQWGVKKTVQNPKFTDHLDTTTPRDQAVFWSGKNGQVMAGKSGAAMGSTEGGKWGGGVLSGLGLDWPAQRRAWMNLSRRYAQNAKGKVRVYLESGQRPESIFNQVEITTLMKNPDVSGIEIFVMKGGAWVRDSLVTGGAGK